MGIILNSIKQSVIFYPFLCGHAMYYKLNLVKLLSNISLPIRMHGVFQFYMFCKNLSLRTAAHATQRKAAFEEAVFNGKVTQLNFKKQ